MTSSAHDIGTDRVRSYVDARVGWIVIDNPERQNALTEAMRDAILPMLESFRVDPNVAVIVVKGAGEQAFVAGADIGELGTRLATNESRAANVERAARFAAAWRVVEKPVIAMIRGYCLGFGLLLALLADIRIASDDSQFAIPAALLGVGYPYVGVVPLVELVGPGWASEILFTGRRLRADEASRIGLVNRTVPAAELEDDVRQLASAIAANAPLTVKACRAAIRETGAVTPDLDRVSRLVEACFDSEDFAEGRRAFHEKRRPQFKGH